MGYQKSFHLREDWNFLGKRDMRRLGWRWNEFLEERGKSKCKRQRKESLASLGNYKHFGRQLKEVRWRLLDPVTLTNPWKDFIYWKEGCTENGDITSHKVKYVQP